jgi:Transcription factor zinc-finger
MPEKDAFGDKLKDRERAEEDLYFAKRDRELVEKMRGQDDAGREAAARELARGRCPRCGQRLAHRSIDGVEVDECASCRGIWLDEGEFEALSRREGESWLGRLLRHSLTQTR